MLNVGLTGNIASGKSEVVRVWRELGGRVIDSDELARRAVEPGTEALEAIVQRWGTGVLEESGALDRAALRDVVFRDPAERARLEQIVHPAVRRMREDELRAAEMEGERLAVSDIPLLFEVGLEKELDLVVLVDASRGTRLRRLMRKRGLDRAEAERMIDAQMPSERKRKHAALVIDNEGTLEELEERARDVWRELVQRAESHA